MQRLEMYVCVWLQGRHMPALSESQEIASLSKQPRSTQPRPTAAPTQKSAQALQQQILFFVDRIKASTSHPKANPTIPQLPLPAPHSDTSDSEPSLPPSLVSTPRENLIVKYISAARPASSPSRSGEGGDGLGFAPTRRSTDSSSRFMSPSRRKARNAAAMQGGAALEAFSLRSTGASAARPPSAAARLRGAVSGGAAGGSSTHGGVGAAHMSRPSTAASSSTGAWSMASAPDVLDSISQRFSVFALERTAQQLRDALQEETAALQADREFLEVCIREETEVKLALARELSQRRQAAAGSAGGDEPEGGDEGGDEPTLEELKSFKSKLQSTWLAMEEEQGGLQPVPRPPTPERRPVHAEGTTPPVRRGGRLRAALAHSDSEPGAGAGTGAAHGLGAAGRARPGTSSGSPGRNKAGTAAGILDDLDELFGD